MGALETPTPGCGPDRSETARLTALRRYEILDTPRERDFDEVAELGLSMIYGFAKPSGGQVRIHSEESLGTTVSIHLPHHRGEAERDEAPRAPGLHPMAQAGETVLIVDDGPTVRKLVTDVLSDLGYTAVEPADGAGGLRVLQSDARIDLLVTDVGLPGGLNGRQMADAARVARPGLKVLFITGFARATPSCATSSRRRTAPPVSRSGSGTSGSATILATLTRRFGR